MHISCQWRVAFLILGPNIVYPTIHPGIVKQLHTHHFHVFYLNDSEIRGLRGCRGPPWLGFCSVNCCIPFVCCVNDPALTPISASAGPERNEFRSRIRGLNCFTPNRPSIRPI